MSRVLRRGHRGDPFCEPEHTTVCDDGHDNDGNGMLYYIIVQCLSRLGLAGEDISSRRRIGNLMIRKNAIAVRSWPLADYQNIGCSQIEWPLYPRKRSSS